MRKGGEIEDLVIRKWIYNIYPGQWEGSYHGNEKELCLKIKVTMLPMKK